MSEKPHSFPAGVETVSGDQTVHIWMEPSRANQHCFQKTSTYLLQIRQVERLVSPVKWKRRRPSGKEHMGNWQWAKIRRRRTWLSNWHFLVEPCSFHEDQTPPTAPDSLFWRDVNGSGLMKTNQICWDASGIHTLTDSALSLSIGVILHSCRVFFVSNKSSSRSPIQFHFCVHELQTIEKHGVNIGRIWRRVKAAAHQLLQRHSDRSTKQTCRWELQFAPR